MKAAVDFVFRPVGFFRASSVGAVGAVVPVLLYTGITCWSAVMIGRGFGGGTLSVVVLVFSSFMGVVLSSGLLAGSVLLVNMMFFGSFDHRRLLMFFGVTHWALVPWSVLSLLLALNTDVPDLSGLSAESIERRAAAYNETPAVLTARLFGAYFGLWHVALSCCAMRAVSGASARGAWVAGVLLAALFVVLPWVLQRF